MPSADALNEARLAKKAADEAAKKPLTQEQIDAKTAEQVAAGAKSTDRANRLEGETASEANARITAGYKNQEKPELTLQGEALGAQIKFVREGAGGVGKYKEVYGIGVAIPEVRATKYGNTYDSEGNLLSGTGLKKSGIKMTVLKTPNSDGSETVTYSDGTSAVINPTVGNTSAVTTASNSPTTNIQVLKAALRSLGFTSAIIDSSTSFLDGLLKDGLDYDNATEIFLNSKEYTLKSGTKIESPFYKEYGYLNEGLTVPKSASELFNTVEGFKGVVDKYKLSSKYLTQDNLKLYVKNDVTVTDLAERAATAQLRAVESDPFQVKALISQGYINSASDLTDFYMDPKIGKEQLELNRQTGVFTAEALRRAKSGILASSSQLGAFKQLTATLAAKGYSEAQISQLAGTGFENIAGTLNPLTMYSQIYEKAGGTKASNEVLQSSLQTELMGEQFLGTESGKRKKLTELAKGSFEARTGFYGGKSSTAGAI